MVQKIKALEDLARETIGDGKGPELYFVTDGGVVVTVTCSYRVAWAHYTALSNEVPLRECALEARSYGTVASVSPTEDDSTILRRESAPERAPH